MPYSQLDDESKILEFFQGKTNGFFVDIGAGDGVTDSNTRKLWELGWSGVLVEANYIQFVKLKENYATAKNVVCLNVAIATRDSIMTFYRHPYLLGWSSIDDKWVDGWKGDAIPEPVLGVRLERLNLGNRPDLLTIDTEGKDADIIESLPQTFRPKLIIAEIDKFDARQRINRTLNSRGYALVWENKANGAWQRRD